jgi:peroxiredoxin 2/4
MADLISIPRIGDIAPDFTAVTTHSPSMRFFDWQGDSWVVLFSHPADFTPVCTTELSEFARRAGEFTALNAKLIGLSIDSIHSHLAWIQNIKQIMGIQIPYPMIADLDMKVAAQFGMIHPGESSTVTVRTVFVIDPKRTIRAIIYYPLSIGRNIDEIVRLLTALQTVDEHSCATPVNWRPGDKVVVPPPKTVADVEERLSHKGNDREVKDFYLSLRKL